MDNYIMADIIWKVVPFAINYKCSVFGEIRNVKTNKILAQQLDDSGYKTLKLYITPDEKAHYRVHRIVALTWIENPDNKPTVDHIDRNPANNAVVNLKWANYKEQGENTVHDRSNDVGKAVWQLDINTGNKIKLHQSAKDAVIDLGKNEKINAVNFIRIAAKKGNTNAYGYKWEYDIRQIEEYDNEEWKLYIEITNNKYYVSNYGRIKNNDQLMVGFIKKGYYYVSINKKNLRVHILVAKLFVKNDDEVNNNIVNHKDLGKLNNKFSNLEWTTTALNNLHAIQNSSNPTHKKVVNFDKDNNILGTYLNISDAGRALEADISYIRRCCNNFHKKYVGDKLRFKYLDDEEVDIENMKIVPKEVKKLPRVRKISVYDKDGNFLETCNNVLSAHKKYKIGKGTIKNHCENKVKFNNIDYVFKYSN